MLNSKKIFGNIASATALTTKGAALEDDAKVWLWLQSLPGEKIVNN